MKMKIEDNVYIDTEQRKELFNSLVKPQIKPRETTEAIAKEYIRFRNLYGAIVTQEDYAKVKGVTAVTLNKELNKLPEYTEKTGKQIKK